MDSNFSQRPALNGFHQRKAKSNQPTHVSSNGVLPTTEDLPEAPADLAEALATWHELRTAERDQARLAAAANGQAAAAAAAYRRDVGTALSQRKDPAKVKDKTEQHKAIAAAHVGFSNDARSQRERLGYDLGLMLEQAAPSLHAPIEQRIEKSARTVRGSLTAVREAWSVYSGDFEMRRWLSHVELDGGRVGAYHGAGPLPAEVVAALAVLEDHISSLDKLRSDEEQVKQHRATDAARASHLTRDAYVQRTSKADTDDA